MFGNKKEQSFTSPSAPAPQQMSGSSTRHEITTLLSEGCRFEGNMFAPSNTRVDGDVKGNINGQSLLVIGEKGKIEGDVTAVDVVIYGNVNGTVKSHKLELKKGCRLTGDVIVEVFVTEAGVMFNGRCSMEQKRPQQQPVQQQQQPSINKQPSLAKA